MKKIIALLTVLMLCATLVVPVSAENEFKPSVENKPAPEIVPVPDEDGNPALAMLIDGDGLIIDYIYESDGCLVITPVSRAEESEIIPDDARNLLLDVYAKLLNGSMFLPYEKFDAGLISSNMIIRDLFDATFLCGDHPEMLLPEGSRLVITFDLGVAADEDVFTMTYNSGEWNPIVSTVNNDDGTVTCVFEHLCPIAFSVEGDVPPVQTGDPAGDQLNIWFMICGISLLAVIVLTAFYLYNSKKYSK